LLKFNANIHGLDHLGKLSGGYFVTTIINQALPFLILPILTRYLSPAEYGNLALFSLYLALSNSLSGASVPTVISKYYFSKDKEYIARIIGNSILIVALLSLATMLIIVLLDAFLKSFFQLPLIWLLSIPVTSFAFIILSMGLTIMINTQSVVLFGKYQVGNTAINLSISILLIVFLMWGWHGRVLGIIISYIISAGGAYYYLRKNGLVSFDISKSKINTIIKVAIPLIPNSFQIVVISQVGIFFMQFYFTKHLLGLYSIGFQISVMVKLLTDTLNMSWSPFLFHQLSNEKAIDRLYLTRLIWVLIFILVAGLLFINLTAGIILKLMTTVQYYGAREFILWFTLGFLFYGIYTFLFPILVNHEKQKFISTITFLNMLVMIVLNLWFIQLFGYIGIAYAFTMTYLLMLLTFFGKAQQVFPLPWLRALKIWNR
jgi:O-antigen/teichoic acid export membrane protein